MPESWNAIQFAWDLAANDLSPVCPKCAEICEPDAAFCPECSSRLTDEVWSV